MMEATIKRAIERTILTEFPSTDLEYDIDWEIMEISFKAGRELVLEEHGRIYLEGKQVGIREVVEWIKEMTDTESVKEAPKLIGFTMLSEDWQAKLKEWGIDEKE